MINILFKYGFQGVGNTVERHQPGLYRRVVPEFPHTLGNDPVSFVNAGGDYHQIRYAVSHFYGSRYRY
jgi:hypothetical protein